jgi:cell division protein ZapA
MAETGSLGSLVHVEIFGQTYTLRAGTEPGYVEELARYVDQQMREVSRSGPAVDSVRIAVLAALNIADECFQARGRIRGADEATRRKVEGLASELSAVLGESHE